MMCGRLVWGCWRLVSWGPWEKGRPHLRRIRYQLLTGSAAALSHAVRVGAWGRAFREPAFSLCR
jgi:hypothetical protein